MPKTIEELEEEIAILNSKHAGELAQKDKLIEESVGHAAKLTEKVTVLTRDLKIYRDDERKSLEDEFHSLKLPESQRKIYTAEKVGKMSDAEIKVYVEAFTAADEAHTAGKKTPGRSQNLPGNPDSQKEKSRIDTFLDTL